MKYLNRIEIAKKRLPPDIDLDINVDTSRDQKNVSIRIHEDFQGIELDCNYANCYGVQ